uniref:Uncharacterized protein n=1 Tax=Corvus moneduloides TaxID=1196302 RepID=A0A8U7NSY3_CORMO
CWFSPRPEPWAATGRRPGLDTFWCLEGVTQQHLQPAGHCPDTDRVSSTGLTCSSGLSLQKAPNLSSSVRNPGRMMLS